MVFDVKITGYRILLSRRAPQRIKPGVNVTYFEEECTGTKGKPSEREICIYHENSYLAFQACSMGDIATDSSWSTNIRRIRTPRSAMYPVARGPHWKIVPAPLRIAAAIHSHSQFLLLLQLFPVLDR